MKHAQSVSPRAQADTYIEGFTAATRAGAAEKPVDDVRLREALPGRRALKGQGSSPGLWNRSQEPCRRRYSCLLMAAVPPVRGQLHWIAASIGRLGGASPPTKKGLPVIAGSQCARSESGDQSRSPVLEGSVDPPTCCGFW
ncbi:hypothetical protein NDU88_004928 [Pleurodeles waltl]|uniref:Uncharacterized protein n=1 Tax=Pleurodeles waltl TaxID=8319 RepID=A0AAV7TV49_PLEWA|nr:hypothetical protein NDU88_004928 [Pleurodeles waltl]